MTEELHKRIDISWLADTAVQVWNTIEKKVIGVYETNKDVSKYLGVTNHAVQHSYSRKTKKDGKIKSEKFYSDIHPGIPLVARIIKRTEAMTFQHGLLKQAA